MLSNVHWLGHASVNIAGSRTVYIDPWKIKSDTPKADLVLVTHEHYDHCSPEDIEKLLKEDTVIVATPDCMSKLSGNLKSIRPGSSLAVAGIDVRAVRAYNIGKEFHPMAKDWVGYVFRVDDVTYYHCGDTDAIPEMKEIETDVAFLAVGGNYTMDADGAAEAAEMINPKIAVPIHWGEIIGSEKDAQRFKKKCSCDVEILPRE